MRPITPATLAAWIIIGLLAFGPPLNLPAIELPWLPIGVAAPFKTDSLAVLIVEETENRTPALENIYSAVESHVKAAGGKFRKLDQNQSDLSADEQWVRDAWRVKGTSVPWIVAATARIGINESLPANEADALKALAPLGVK